MESLSILLRTAPKIRPRDLNAMYDNTVSLDNYWLDPSWSVYVFPSRLPLGRKCHRRQFPYSIQCKPSTISIEESLGPLNDSLIVLEIETITIAKDWDTLITCYTKQNESSAFIFFFNTTLTACLLFPWIRLSYHPRQWQYTIHYKFKTSQLCKWEHNFALLTLPWRRINYIYFHLKVSMVSKGRSLPWGSWWSSLSRFYFYSWFMFPLQVGW